MTSEFPHELEVQPSHQIHVESVVEADPLDPSVIWVLMPEWVEPKNFGLMPMTKGLFYHCGWSRQEREKVLASSDLPRPVIINGTETWTIYSIWEWLKTKDGTFCVIIASFSRRWIKPTAWPMV